MIENQGESNRAKLDGWHVVMDILLPNRSNLADAAVGHVTLALQPLGLSTDRLEKLKTALMEAAGQTHFHQPMQPVGIRVLVSHFPEAEEAEVLEKQPSSEWGFFMVEKRIAETDRGDGEAAYILQVFLYLEGENPPVASD